MLPQGTCMDRRRLIAIFMIVFTNVLGGGVILPILPLLAEGQMGATAFQATALNTAYWAASFLAAPVLGRLSDIFGRRPVLIISQIGTVLSFVMFIFAGQMGAGLENAGLRLGISGALFVAYLARTLDGLTGGNITTAQAYITDISTPETRAQALGTLSAGFGLGFIFGPVFGGFLATINVTAPFVGAALITLGSVTLTTLILPESLPPEMRASARQKDRTTTISTGQLLRERGVTIVLVTNFMIVLAFAALQSTFALFADRVLFPELGGSQLVARNVGLLLTLVGIVSVLTQLFLIRPLIKRLGERRLVIVGISALALGFLATGLAQSVLVVAISIIPISFGQGVIQPSLQSVITRFGTDQMRGRLLGIYQSASSLALIAGPLWGGYVFEQVNPHAPYLLSVPLLLLAAGCAFLLLRDPSAERVLQRSSS
ncbi:MAG: MFS transporter [Anaerolineales bacterium]|nr:MFS transporter [Anaerolineales bacterium]